jgi:hypothetical protein
MKKVAHFSTRTLLLLFCLSFLCFKSANAQCLLTNNNFETGNLSGWTVYNRTTNSANWYNYTGTVSPLSGFAIPAPPEGTRGAVSDHTGPTTQALYQDVTLPAGQSTLKFFLAYNNTHTSFVTLNTLDYNGNQQFRVDLIRTTAGIESVAASDVIASLFQTQPGDPTGLNSPLPYFYDTTAFAGQTVRLRFAEAVGLNYFPVAIDNTCITSSLQTFTRNTVASGASAVNLDFGDVIVTYPTVTTTGVTSVQQLGVGTQTAPPPGDTFVGPAYDISTTAITTTPITVCIKEPGVADTSHLRLLHKEAGIWVDLPTSRISTSGKYVCGQVTTLSPFVVANNAAVPTSAQPTLSGTVTDAGGAPLAGVTVNLDGAAKRKTITDSAGNYHFEDLTTGSFYTVTPSRLNYNFEPADRSLSLLTNVSNATFSGNKNGSANVIDSPDYFVRQNYLDFLGREPDEAGFNFWSDQIISCGADAGCAERRTINVSAAYFLSIEFMETGGLVDGLYRASYNRRAQYVEFMPDTATVANGVIVGSSNWAATLAANKEAFVNAWVQRPEFQAAYGSLDNTAYVDALISHAGGFNGDRDAIVSGLNGNTLTRAAALRAVAENEGFNTAKHNGMFVMMEYFGYLRRDPDESGFNFWLNKLNQHNGNFEQAEMVKSFIVSGEYRSRFINQ